MTTITELRTQRAAIRQAAIDAEAQRQLAEFRDNMEKRTADFCKVLDLIGLPVDKDIIHDGRTEIDDFTLELEYFSTDKYASGEPMPDAKFTFRLNVSYNPPTTPDVEMYLTRVIESKLPGSNFLWHNPGTDMTPVRDALFDAMDSLSEAYAEAVKEITAMKPAQDEELPVNYPPAYHALKGLISAFAHGWLVSDLSTTDRMIVSLIEWALTLETTYEPDGE